MTQDIMAASYSDFALNQNEFEIKDEFQEERSSKIYRVKNYVETKFHHNFSKSCVTIASCAAMCVITIIIIVIINSRHELSKDDFVKVLSDSIGNKNRQLLSCTSNTEQISIVTSEKPYKDELANDSSIESPYYYLPEVLLSDNNKLWLFNLESKSASLFYEDKSTIDTFDIFTKENVFFSSFQDSSTTIYSSNMNKKNESNKNSFDKIIDKIRFRSRGIAFDFIGKNLYAVDEITGILVLLNLDTKLLTVLLSNLIQPRHVYVDSFQRSIFILQVSHSIIKGDMNGENMYTVTHGTGLTIMAIDYSNKRVYWVNDGVGIVSSDYNGFNHKKFPTNTATILDLTIANNKIFWIWQNHHYPDAHHLLFCKIVGNQCKNHEMQILENLHNLTTIKSVCGLKQNLSYLISNPCEVNNGGCEHLCLFISNESYSCACKLGWQLNPDMRTCFEVFNFILYASKNLIRGHSLDVAGTILTNVILPTACYTQNLNSAFVFDYDQLNDNLYFSDSQNIYRTKIQKYKYERQHHVYSNVNDKIIDVAYDVQKGNLYSYECQSCDASYSYPKSFVLKMFFFQGTEMVLKHTQEVQHVYRGIHTSGINVHNRQPLIFFIDETFDSEKGEIKMLKDYFGFSSITSTSTSITVHENILSLSRPTAIDYQENKLYWIDKLPRVVIRCATFDGGDLKEITVSEAYGARYIFVLHQWIYLASENSIWRIHKNNIKNVVMLVSETELMNDVRLISRKTI